MMEAGSKKVNVQAKIEVGMKAGKPRRGKGIIMVVEEETRQPVSMDIIRPTTVHSLEPNVV